MTQSKAAPAWELTHLIQPGVLMGSAAQLLHFMKTFLRIYFYTALSWLLAILSFFSTLALTLLANMSYWADPLMLIIQGCGGKKIYNFPALTAFQEGCQIKMMFEITMA